MADHYTTKTKSKTGNRSLVTLARARAITLLSALICLPWIVFSTLPFWLVSDLESYPFPTILDDPFPQDAFIFTLCFAVVAGFLAVVGISFGLILLVRRPSLETFARELPVVSIGVVVVGLTLGELIGAGDAFTGMLLAYILMLVAGGVAVLGIICGLVYLIKHPSLSALGYLLLNCPLLIAAIWTWITVE